MAVPTDVEQAEVVIEGTVPANEDAADERALAEALAGRRVVGSHLYGSVKGSDVIDLYATYWVTRAQAQPHR